MNKLGFILLIVVIVAVIVVYKWPTQYPLVTIAPQQCVFQVYEHWSPTFQASIIAAIKDWYATSKSADFVIEKMTANFPEVGSVQAQICSADKICFYIDGVQPIFLLNNQQIIGSTGTVSKQDDFSLVVQQELPKVFSDSTDEYPEMVRFIQQLEPTITTCHDVTWKNRHEIILQPRGTQGMRCIARDGKVPLFEDIQRCHGLYETHIASLPKKKAKQIIMEYDIRFKNQIIVKTGG